jgi:hypothetical protein
MTYGYGNILAVSDEAEPWHNNRHTVPMHSACYNPFLHRLRLSK